MPERDSFHINKNKTQKLMNIPMKLNLIIFLFLIKIIQMVQKLKKHYQKEKIQKGVPSLINQLKMKKQLKWLILQIMFLKKMMGQIDLKKILETKTKNRINKKKVASKKTDNIEIPPTKFDPKLFEKIP
jgi:hypothetical protein